MERGRKILLYVTTLNVSERVGKATKMDNSIMISYRSVNCSSFIAVQPTYNHPRPREMEKCNNTFRIDLAPNGISFGDISFGKV